MLQGSPPSNSVYSEPDAHRSVCKARAEWFREQSISEFRWPWFALGPVLVAWLLLYSDVDSPVDQARLSVDVVTL
jgi:hypothetical protein